MEIVILEDQESEREALLKFLKRYTDETGYDLSALLYAAPEEIPEKISLFEGALLDIIIDGRPQGVEVARELRKRGFDGPIVFLTVSRDYYAEGFEVDAAHYLVKPYTYEAFREAMERMIRQAGRPRRTILLPVGRRQASVVVSEIRYIEVYGKETLVYTGQGKLKVRLPLREMEALLGESSFLRCFRSCIVNMEHIVRMEGDSFVLDNGSRVPITLRNKLKIQEQYLDYRFEKMRGGGA